MSRQQESTASSRSPDSLVPERRPVDGADAELAGVGVPAHRLDLVLDGGARVGVERRPRGQTRAHLRRQ